MGLDSGMLNNMVGNNESLRGIDFDSLIQMVEQGAVGKLVDNPISLKLAASKISQHSPLKVTPKELKAMLGEVEDYKAESGGKFLLVDVESSDGTSVRIWI